ncbi:uncharacterized protein WM277_001124 isoform 1-T1 [Molossus nigricans]
MLESPGTVLLPSAGPTRTPAATPGTSSVSLWAPRPPLLFTPFSPSLSELGLTPCSVPLGPRRAVRAAGHCTCRTPAGHSRTRTNLSVKSPSQFPRKLKVTHPPGAAGLGPVVRGKPGCPRATGRQNCCHSLSAVDSTGSMCPQAASRVQHKRLPAAPSELSGPRRPVTQEASRCHSPACSERPASSETHLSRRGSGNPTRDSGPQADGPTPEPNRPGLTDSLQSTSSPEAPTGVKVAFREGIYAYEGGAVIRANSCLRDSSARRAGPPLLQTWLSPVRSPVWSPVLSGWAASLCSPEPCPQAQEGAGASFASCSLSLRPLWGSVHN